MSKLTIDSSLAQELRKQPSSIELCDASGAPVGFFVPANMSLTAFLERLYPPKVSLEEVERRRKESTYYTTAEILRKLESL
jgi:hypothetical protein